MKAVVAAFNQEEALVGAFSVIMNLRMQLFEALVASQHDVSRPPPPTRDRGSIIPLQLGELAARRRPAQQAPEDPLHPRVLPPAALRPNLRGQHQVRPHTSISTEGELR